LGLFCTICHVRYNFCRFWRGKHSFGFAGDDTGSDLRQLLSVSFQRRLLAALVPDRSDIIGLSCVETRAKWLVLSVGVWPSTSR